LEFYNKFLDLAEPLLDSRLMDDDESDELFWYGFHSDDRTMLLRRLLPEYPERPPATYFHLRKERCSGLRATSSLEREVTYIGSDG
jgi:hypothetical protein